MWCFSHCENAQKSSSGTLLLSVDGPPAALEAIRESSGTHRTHESPWLRVALPSGARRGSPSKMNVLSAFRFWLTLTVDGKKSGQNVHLARGPSLGWSDVGEVGTWNICSWGAVLCYIHEPWRGCWPPSRGSFDWFATVISADRWPWLPSRHAPAPRQACTRVPAPLLSRCAMSPEFTQLSIPCTCQVQLCMPVFTG